MSVVASKRGEGQLLVVTKANELLEYTIRVCSNEKNFPKRYRWCLTNKLIDATEEMTSLIIRANAVYVRKDDIESINRRLTYQNEAIELTYVLLNQINIAYKIFGIKSSKIEHWTRLIMEIQRLLRNWHKNDKTRYKG